MTSRILLRAAMACALAFAVTLAAQGHSEALGAKARAPVERLESAAFR